MTINYIISSSIIISISIIMSVHIIMISDLFVVNYYIVVYSVIVCFIGICLSSVVYCAYDMLLIVIRILFGDHPLKLERDRLFVFVPQRRLAWPLRKDDTHKSKSVNNVIVRVCSASFLYVIVLGGCKQVRDELRDAGLEDAPHLGNIITITTIVNSHSYSNSSRSSSRHSKSSSRCLHC